MELSRVHKRGVCLIAAAGLAVLQSAAQDAPPNAGQPQPPSGFQITSISIFGGAYFLPKSGAQSVTSSLPDAIPNEGSAVSALWALRSPRAEAVFSYDGSYTRNQDISALNGFDHRIAINLRRSLSPRTTLAFDLVGESTLLANAMFTPSQTANSGQATSGTNTGSTGSGLYPALDEPSVMLQALATRRKMAGLTVRESHDFSTRLQSTVRVGIAREELTQDGSALDLLVYPVVTVGTAGVSLSYGLTQKSRLIWSADYWRSYSRLYDFDVESSTLGWERLIGQRSFWRVEGGYARTGPTNSGADARNGYVASTAIGTSRGALGLLITVRREVADFQGLRSGNTLAGDAALSWNRPGSPWTFTCGGGYERLQSSLGLLNTWLGRALLARKISDHLQIQAEVAYVKAVVPELNDLARRGVRVAFVWTPAQGAARAR